MRTARSAPPRSARSWPEADLLTSGKHKVPLLRDLVAWAATPSNLVVAHQDRVVVEIHRPARPGLPIDEKLIPGDRPVIEYRRQREALIWGARRRGHRGRPDDRGGF